MESGVAGQALTKVPQTLGMIFKLKKKSDLGSGDGEAREKSRRKEGGRGLGFILAQNVTYVGNQL